MRSESDAPTGRNIAWQVSIVCTPDNTTDTYLGHTKFISWSLDSAENFLFYFHNLKFIVLSEAPTLENVVLKTFK